MLRLAWLVCCVVVFGLWFVTRLTAWIVQWALKKYLGADLKIGRVGIFSLKKIQLVIKPVVSVEIEQIWLSSSIVNPDVARKPLMICGSDVRVQLDISREEESNGREVVNISNSSREKTLTKAAHVLQYLGVRIQNVTVIFLKMLVQGCLVHITGQEINIDLSIAPDSFQSTVNISGVVCRALKSVSENIGSPPCLAELSLGTYLDLQLLRNLRQLKLLHLLVSKPQITISEAFLAEIRRIKGKKNPTIQEGRIPINSQKIITAIPKEVGIDITDLSVKIERERKRSSISVNLKTFHIELHDQSNQDECIQVVASLLIEEFSTKSMQRKFAGLNKLQLKLQVNKYSTDCNVSLHAGHFQYHCEEIQYWLSLALQFGGRKENVSSLTCVPVYQPQKEATNLLSNIVKACVTGRKLACTVHLTEIACAASTALCSGLVLGVSQLKTTWNSRQRFKALGENSCIQSHDMTCEVDVHTAYCHLADTQDACDEMNRKNHYWGQMMYLGIVMIKVKKLGNEIKLEGMKDNVQLEWSTKAVDTVLQLANSLHLVRSQLSTALSSSPSSLRQQALQPPEQPSLSLIYQVNFKISDINIFACNNYKVCLMLRVDATCLDYRQSQAISEIEGAKIIYFHTQDLHQPLMKCADLQDSIVHVQEVKVSFKQPENELTVRVLKEVCCCWSTCAHLCFDQVIQDFQEVQHNFSECKTSKPGETSLPDPDAESSTEAYFSKLSINLVILARTSLTVQLSQQHRVRLETASVVLTRSPQDFLMEITKIDLLFNGHVIFAFEGALLGTLPDCFLHREREGFKELKLTNQAWNVCLEKISIVFPYQFNFAACYEELINIVKWLKLVHKVKKKCFTAESRMPPDIQIKIKEFLAEVSDDPFEVKLGDNYQLLKDEWAENEKRRTVMDQKIQSLRKAHGLLPGSRVVELYASLAKKSAEIYIQRSHQLYAYTPMRTKLFTWRMENLEIVALADHCYHGKEKVVRHMQQINVDSQYPDDELEFSTLWCRMVNCSVKRWSILLRDYAQPLFEIKDMHTWGKLVGAEQDGTNKAKRTCVVHVEEPWGDMTVERNLHPLKFFHDLSCDIESFTMAYGSCWEPTVAQLNLLTELINKPSVDPSLPMPFWDKLRLLLHGRLTMSVQQMSWLYHASLDPHNVTEFMDWTWSNLILDWTNGKFTLNGDLDLYARTASKYDDCMMLHLPNLKFCVRLEWICLGEPNDHYSVFPYAPDKVPDYSLEEHDSFRAFRSQNLNLNVTLETKARLNNPLDVPSCLFFASTLRFMDKIKMCMSHVTRPTKRGVLFENTKPKKPQLSRHYKNIKMSVNFHQFNICYWMSFSKQHGAEMQTESFNLELCNGLLVQSVEDGLIHRPQAIWIIRYLTCELSTTKLWLCSVPSATEEVHTFPPEDFLHTTSTWLNKSLRAPVDRSVFLSVSRVSYQRADDENRKDEETEKETAPKEITPTHMVHVYDMKGAWTRSNRMVLLGLYDGYRKAQSLKRNLSSDALKGFRVDSSQSGNRSKSSSLCLPGSSPGSLTPSPLSRLHSGHAYAMLTKLVSETDSKSVAFTEEPSAANMEQLHGIAACQTDDVLRKNWLIVLHNSQVMLKGCETAGYVIVSASKAQILSCTHQPVWRDRELCSKTTWVGSVECMQYYATVDPGEEFQDDDIAWLTKENVEERSETDLEGVPEMVGSGQSVGGVVSSTVGGTGQNAAGKGTQLQRIISRCRCQFFYAGYGELKPTELPEVPLPPVDDDSSDMIKEKEVVDTITVLHHDLNVCTNSLQYIMIPDIVNNLLLHVEPNRKEASEKLQSMRFQLQLSTMEDQRTPILQLQENVRKQVQKLRRLEKELYIIHKALDNCSDNDNPLRQSEEIEQLLFDCKEQINALNEELTIRISCLKERQLQFTAQLKTTKAQRARVVRRNEVCFKFAQWRLTETDGQLGITDLALRNFVYTKVNRDNDTWTHQLELGWVKMTNLLPNSIYKDVLVPRDPLGRENENKVLTLRIVCTERPPVGGIAVKEHFEVNLVPLQIQLTYQFFKAMMRFFFPDKNIDVDQPDEEDDGASLKKKYEKKTASKEKMQTSFRRSACQSNTDDIDKMKERAANNNTFLYIKIPEVPLKVSYKGEKEKNIEDVQDFSLVLPTLEYHNRIWTWFDLLMAMKNDTKNVLITQAIRQKIHLRPRTGNELLLTDVQQEEDKAKMLLGAKLLAGQEKPVKKSLFGKQQK